MSRAPSEKLRSLQLEGAERRVRHDLEHVATEGSRARPRVAIGIAALLFAAIFVLRLAVNDPSALVANFYAVPIALVAAELGLRAGLAAAGIAVGCVFAWGAVKGVHLGALGYAARAAVFVMVGGLVGHYSEALDSDLSSRRDGTRELQLRAEELERSNEQLGQAVVRLEAFAEIARSVGGETDVPRVLALILDHGRGVVDARALAICLRQDDELLVAAATEGSGRGHRVPAAGSPLGEVLESGRPARLAAAGGGSLRLAPGLEARAAVVVPLAFRGERLGVLAALDRLSGGPEFDAEDEELIAAVAASAATAVATAQSVAKERLRDSIEAAEQARARWARELHDETLQGLVGLRMMLSSARRSGSSEVLGDAIDHTKREIVNLRALIAELRPAALDELGLGPAIETLADRGGAAAGLDISTRVTLGERDRLAADTESTIYRLVQEALTNVAKHARAERVHVEVARENGMVEVVVEDDGRGFDPAAATHGLGLVGMRERVELTGGRLEIRSRPGTRVMAKLPAA
jgi:two-component system, NarL family, sensor histidine kinase DevS